MELEGGESGASSSAYALASLWRSSESKVLCNAAVTRRNESLQRLPLQSATGLLTTSADFVSGFYFLEPVGDTSGL